MHASKSLGVQPERRVPPYLPLMILVTGAYLTVEVPFSAHLLDVLGGDPTSEDISQIERFGRVLTGFAVAIAVAGAMFARRDGRKSFASSLIVVGLWSAASVFATYHALNFIADGIGEMSSGAERRDAVRTMLARRALIEGVGAQPGMPALSEVAGTPEWKAFLSIAPALGQPQGALLGYVGAQTAKLIVLDAERKVGDPDRLRKEFFRTTFEPIRSAYEQYRSASGRFRKAAADVERGADDAWGQAVRARERHYGRRINPSNVIQFRDNVRKRGVLVPDNWNPFDGETFKSAYRQKAGGDLQKVYVQAMEGALGQGRVLPVGLTWDAFIQASAVQARLREEMGVPMRGPVIREDMSAADFMKGVVEPLRERAGLEAADMLLAPPAQFENGQKYAFAGAEASKAVFVPAMALALSLAGAALHVFKLSYLLAALSGLLLRARRQVLLRLASASLVTGLSGAWLVTPANAVTSSAGYAAVREIAKEGVGLHVADALGIAIDVQKRFQPIGRWVAEFGLYRYVETLLPPARAAQRG